MKNFLLVFIGGGFGSGLRYIISISLDQYAKIFPYSTFLVNAIGCLLIGLIMGYSQKEYLISQNQMLLLTTGFCGGFTTFSAFAKENLKLIEDGEIFNFSIYLLGSIIIGIIAVYVGFQVFNR